MSALLVIKLDALGDVFRTTPVLRLLRRTFPRAHITWATRPEAIELLRNSLLDQVVAIGEYGWEALVQRSFHLAANFDEDRIACELLGRVDACVKKGFVWNASRNLHWPVDRSAEYAWRLSQDDELKFRTNRKTYQEVTFEILGERFGGEDYVLPAFSTPDTEYDVAVNHMVGEKYLTKLWPHWEELEDILREQGATVAVQSSFNSLDGYISWIASAKVVVTSDTLGMHLALAMRKPTVILMGSTSEPEIELYGAGRVINRRLECSPCYKKYCPLQHHKCMVEIEAKDVARLVLDTLIKGSGAAVTSGLAR